MKNKIKTVVKKIMLGLLVLAMVIAGVIIGWEVVRPTVVGSKDAPHILEREVTPPTDFELYVSSKEVQDELALMFKRHQRDTLTKEITELETSKR